MPMGAVSQKSFSCAAPLAEEELLYEVPSNAAKRSALEVIADCVTDDVFLNEGNDEKARVVEVACGRELAR